MKRFLESIGQDILTISSIFDSISDLIFLLEVWEDSFRYVYVNQTALTILNSDESIIGKRLEDVLPQKQAKFLERKYNQVLSTRQPIEIIEEIPTKNKVFIGESSLSPIFTKEGECKFILAIVRDITERKMKERELKLTKKRLSSIIKHNSDAVFEFDLDGNFVRINERATEITGYNENDFIGKSFVPFIVNEYLDDTIMHFGNALRGSNEEYESSIFHKNGHIVELLVKNSPIIVDDTLVGVYGIVKDITEEKKMERLLHESQEKYRIITENAFDLINLISPTGNVEYVSSSHEEVLGYHRSEFIGQSFLSHIHPEDRALSETRFKQLLTMTKPSTFEFRVKHKNGHYIWMEVSTTPVIQNGVVQQFVAVARDITEKKRFREELEKAAFYDYLSGLPNRRTFDDRLEMAIHQADTSNRKVALMMLDGRNFKQINDTYGHDAGDAAILEMAKRLQASVRENDTVARMGGDEFAIILPNIDSVTLVEDIAKRIIHSFEEPMYFHNIEIEMGAGIGISLYPDHTIDKIILVKYADEALYKAKKSNKCEYKFH